MDDDLHELKTYFYLGNYAAAVTEGTTSAMDSTAAALERDVILARIEVATEKADDVIARVGDTSPTALRAVGLYAQYSKNDKSREATMKTLKEMLEDDVDGTNPTLLIMAAIMYADNKEYQNALRYANKGDTLEHAALKVQILIDMDRVDIAKKELAVMKRIDEYATLTQLASCWVNLAIGGENIQEALYSFQELIERHGATDPLLNGVALCNIGLKKYAEAERVLQSALGKNPKFADSLVSSIVCAYYKKKPAELVKRYRTQLWSVAPAEHSWTAADRSFDALFNSSKAAVTGA